MKWLFKGVEKVNNSDIEHEEIEQDEMLQTLLFSSLQGHSRCPFSPAWACWVQQIGVNWLKFILEDAQGYVVINTERGRETERRRKTWVKYYSYKMLKKYWHCPLHHQWNDVPQSSHRRRYSWHVKDITVKVIINIKIIMQFILLHYYYIHDLLASLLINASSFNLWSR